MRTVADRRKRSRAGILALGLTLGLCACGGEDMTATSVPEVEIDVAETVSVTDVVATTDNTDSAENSSEGVMEADSTADVDAIVWSDYGELTEVEEEFTNDRNEKAYYYVLDEFYFSDSKYEKVNEYLRQMYEQYVQEYEAEAEQYTGDYEDFDTSSLPEGQRYNYNRLVFNYIASVDDEYVSLLFNDTIYWAGAAHPQSYFAPVTISVRTGEEVTPEEILGRNWEEIRAAGSIEDENEEEFNVDYGFYLTEKELCYIYRVSHYVEEIRIPR